MINEDQVRIMRLPHAADLPLPAYESVNAAGLDLVAALPAGAPLIIERWCRAAIPTGLTFALPPGVVAQVKPRTGLAFRHGIMVLNGPFDSDYVGEVQVILANFGEEAFPVTRGARIATLVLSATVQATICEISRSDPRLQPTKAKVAV
jgi:dUTP pyrophosphatase